MLCLVRIQRLDQALLTASVASSMPGREMYS
jgi:hypothetical protein